MWFCLEYHTWFHLVYHLRLLHIINKIWNWHYLSFHAPDFRHITSNINPNDNKMHQHGEYTLYSIISEKCWIPICMFVELASFSLSLSIHIQYNVEHFFSMHIYLFDWVGNIRFFSPNANAYFNSKHDYFIKCGSIIGFFHIHIVVSYKPTLFAIAFFPSLTCVLFARAYFFFLLMHVLFT